MSFPAALSFRSEPVDPVQLALFAAASGDHNPLHLDPAFARQAGFERPVVHGMLTMALAGRMFTQHFGPGCVRVLQTRFAGVALVNEVLELTAELERVEAGVAHYALRGRTSGGTEVVSGSAQVTEPARASEPGNR